VCFLVWLWKKIIFAFFIFFQSFGKENHVAADPVVEDDPEVVTVEPMAAVVDPTANSPLPGTPGKKEIAPKIF